MAGHHGGFTLLEAMVTVAVLGILAVMAIPNYMGALARDQIASALPLADIVKAPIALSWTNAQTFPADNASAGLPSADKIVNNYVSSMAIVNGAIEITFGNRASGLISGKVLSLRPAVVADAPIVPVTWVCGYAEGPAKMTVRGDNRTNIPGDYLPPICRSRS
jgi:type IV pilus assembly protein PilA